MDRTEWQRKHQEECYFPLAKEYLKEALDYTCIHADRIHKELTGQLKTFLFNLSELQERGRLGAVGRISISFLYTSLLCGRPCFLFEVYPSIPFLDNALVSREFPLSWMFREWEEFQERVRQETGKQGMNTVIRMPYIRSEAWGTARLAIQLMFTLIKYHFYGIEGMEAYQKLEKTENFVLSFGEYYDWQKPILALKREVDIFQCEKEEDLRFCRFPGKWYEKKEFSQLVLDDCRFQECTFVDSVFVDTSLRDARFLGCSFKNCELSRLLLQGARFDGCVFERVSFSEIKTAAFSYETKEIKGFWGMTEFIGCSFLEVRISLSDFSASLFRDCYRKRVEIEESVLPDGLTGDKKEEKGES